MKTEVCFAMGNEAITEGAIAAGARFYAGYPITPSTEIAELSSKRLPQVGGLYVQMEDELGSIAAVIGASSAGKKAYTATSGPGISLMQENLGVAVMSEVPCVIINVQRSGPSTGLATKPAQGDVMQARWGTHGDHGIIALSPATVQQCYDLTIRAFNLAEKYRTPVYLLADAVVGHLYERYELRMPEAIVWRRQPDENVPDGDFAPFDFEKYPDHIAPMPPFGSRHIFRMNGSGHDAAGFPCGVPQVAQKYIRHLTDKIENNIKDIVQVKEYRLEDAEYAIITFGCSVRPALAAMALARDDGMKVGVLQLITVWPFADDKVKEVLSRVKGVIVPEMNLGQIASEIDRCNKRGIPLIRVNKVDSEIIMPDEILVGIKEAAR